MSRRCRSSLDLFADCAFDHVTSIQRSAGCREYALMVGGGIKGRGGAILLYRSKHIDQGEPTCHQTLPGPGCSLADVHTGL